MNVDPVPYSIFSILRVFLQNCLIGGARKSVAGETSTTTNLSARNEKVHVLNKQACHNKQASHRPPAPLGNQSQDPG